MTPRRAITITLLALAVLLPAVLVGYLASRGQFDTVLDGITIFATLLIPTFAVAFLLAVFVAHVGRAR